MRKKVSVEAITRRSENGDLKEEKDLPQTKLETKSKADIVENQNDTPVNGNHEDDNDQDDRDDGTFDEEDDDKDSSLDPEEELPQQELP